MERPALGIPSRKSIAGRAGQCPGPSVAARTAAQQMYTRVRKKECSEPDTHTVFLYFSFRCEHSIFGQIYKYYGSMFVANIEFSGNFTNRVPFLNIK